MGMPIQTLLWEGGGDVEPDILAFPPSVTGGGPQAVIDRRVWEELGGYDVYLGMMWHRMGTPTGDYRSGTEADERLALVPPTVAAELRAAATDASDKAERLLRRLADETSTPALIVSRLMAEKPGWLASAGAGHLLPTGLRP